MSGLGWQSTAATLMCLHGDLPVPDFFIFADTQWEREGTYENLARLKPMVEKAGYPFHIVTGGNIRQDQIDNIDRVELPYYMNPSRYETVQGRRDLLIKDVTKAYKKMIKRKELNKNDQELLFSDFDDLPLEVYLEVALANFDQKVDEGHIKDGYMKMSTTQIGRQCTLKYKIRPVNSYCRKHYGAHFKTPVGTWLGISTDEWHRMSSSLVKAFVLFYPLIDYGISRDDCKQYMEAHSYPIPVKSSCIGCPFHDDDLWLEMTEAEYADVSKYERTINMNIANSDYLRDRPYLANGVRLHPSMQKICR